ncbi:hypothetical protein CFP56_023550 [Quercus suber]|uniref:Uncharacterized protein n=1 Tax=Quercus suber TaxID=58331 RepID=A0AAW0K7C1_QUESU
MREACSCYCYRYEFLC